LEIGKGQNFRALEDRMRYAQSTGISLVKKSKEFVEKTENLTRDYLIQLYGH